MKVLFGYFVFSIIFLEIPIDIFLNSCYNIYNGLCYSVVCMGNAQVALFARVS